MTYKIGLYPTYGARGTNTHELVLGGVTIWFSYATPVAFLADGEWCISENVWSTTTGAHLNAINDDKNLRIPHAEFVAKLDKLLGRLINVRD